ncbi:hypothetical protein QCA50_013525 [Cerrena zonata]|uniref:Uncharacterized protein n=1 Tax=Cerrena zonata TaxID=2478898 RepID=A0AAW0FQC6_9APHY
MPTSTHFQTVHEAIRALRTKLDSIQKFASQPGHPLYNDAMMRTCFQSFEDLVIDLRTKVVTNACMTINFLVNNIFSKIANPEQHADAKILVIRRFLEAQNLPNNARDVLSLWQKFSQLNESINTNGQLLENIGVNPIATMNSMQTVLTGISSIQRFYQQIEQSLRGFKDQLDQGATQVEGVEQEVKWLAAMSVDLRNI